jgi:hypothetical protein
MQAHKHAAPCQRCQGCQDIQNPKPQTHLDVCELMEVCGKQAGGPDVAHDVLSNGPGQSKAVIGGCAAAKLVND